jgi:hypothetical protein
MSSTFFPVSAASASGSKEPECEPSRSVRSSRSPAAFSVPDGLTCLVTTTLEPSPPIVCEQTELFLTSSVGGSRAKTYPLPGPSWGLMAKGRDYGRRSLDYLANYDPISSSWRTSQTCLVSGLAEFSETWPRSGTMRSGIAYQRLTLGPGIGGTEYGWLPTPTKTADAKGAPKNRYFGSPTCRSNLREWLRDGPDDPIFPHPSFVERVMGFPIGWTELDHLAMPSSRKSRKSSGGQS